MAPWERPRGAISAFRPRSVVLVRVAFEGWRSRPPLGRWWHKARRTAKPSSGASFAPCPHARQYTFDHRGDVATARSAVDGTPLSQLHRLCSGLRSLALGEQHHGRLEILRVIAHQSPTLGGLERLSHHGPRYVLRPELHIGTIPANLICPGRATHPSCAARPHFRNAENAPNRMERNTRSTTRLRGKDGDRQPPEARHRSTVSSHHDFIARFGTHKSSSRSYGWSTMR